MTDAFESCCSCVRRLQLNTMTYARYDFALTNVGFPLPSELTDRLTQVRCMSCGTEFYVGHVADFFTPASTLTE